jgi:hypothetical protein
MSLQDVRIKKTLVQIGEEKYFLAYDFNAFAEIEEIYGSVDEGFKAMGAGSVRAIRDFLRIGFMREHDLTDKQVGALFDFSQLQELTALIKEAIEKATPPQPEQPKARKPQTPKDDTPKNE